MAPLIGSGYPFLCPWFHHLDADGFPSPPALSVLRMRAPAFLYGRHPHTSDEPHSHPNALPRPRGAGAQVPVATGHPPPGPRVGGRRACAQPGACSRVRVRVLALSIAFSSDEQTNKNEKGHGFEETCSNTGDGDERGAPLRSSLTLNSLLWSAARLRPPPGTGEPGKQGPPLRV